jgi:phosphatidylglycerophosphate synthase
MQTMAAKPEMSFRDADRAHSSLTAAAEKKCLVWLAARMPAWVNSDHLTALGFFGMVMVGASYALAGWNRAALLVGILSLAVNWFGDSLDGTLARVRQHQRPKYGFYVDHVVDTFGAAAVMGGLALSGVMSPAVAAGILVAYFMLAIEIYLAAYSVGTFHLSFWKFGPTELRILLAIGNVRVFLSPTAHLFGAEFLLFDIGGVIGIAGLLATMIVSTVRHTRMLYQMEPLTQASRLAARREFAKGQ